MAKLNPHDVKCPRCGTVFTALRAEARYCSLACRVAGHYARHKPPAPPPMSDEEMERWHDKLVASHARMVKVLQDHDALLDEMQADLESGSVAQEEVEQVRAYIAEQREQQVQAYEAIGIVR